MTSSKSKNKCLVYLFVATTTMIQGAFIPRSSNVLHPPASVSISSSNNRDSPQLQGRPPLINTSKIRTTGINRRSSTILFEAREKNFLMDEFRTADGEIVNPYRELKVDRNASRAEIRSSYRKLSKKYHPDATRFSKVLPGNCNNLDDTRDAWERIKLSYEILSDKKTRLKYDRQSALNDPGQALGRAALKVVGWGVTGFAKGIIEIGVAAAEAATNTIQEKSPTSPAPTPKSKPPVEDQKILKKQGIDDEGRLQNVTEQKLFKPEEKLESEAQHPENQPIATEYKHESLAELEAEELITKTRKRQLEEDAAHLQEVKLIEAMLREEARLAEEVEKNRNEEMLREEARLAELVEKNRIEEMLREEARLAELVEKNQIEEKRLRKTQKEQQIAADILRSVTAQQIRLKRGRP